MNSGPEILRTAARSTAVVHLVIKRDEMRNVFGPAVMELMKVLSAQGIKPAGPVYAYHSKMHPDAFDLEVGVPIDGTVQPSGRVKQSELPARKVARTVYTGPYEGLGEAWGEFHAWMDAQGLKHGEDLWETYVAGPGSGTGPENWRTELTRPLIG